MRLPVGGNREVFIGAINKGESGQKEQIGRAGRREKEEK